MSVKRKKKKLGKEIDELLVKNNQRKENLRKIILYGWMLLLIILPFLRAKTLAGSASKYFTSIIVILILATVAIVWGILKTKLLWPSHTLARPFLFYLTTLIVTTILSTEPRSSIFGIYPIFHVSIIANILCLIFFYLVLISQPSKEEIKNFLKILTITAVFISIHAIFERYGWLHIGNWKVAVPSARAIGILQNSDYTLSYLLFFLPLLVYYYSQEKIKSLKIIYASIIPIILFSVLTLCPRNLQLTVIDIFKSGFGITFLVILIICLSLAYLQKEKITNSIYRFGCKKILYIILLFVIASSFLLYIPLKNPVSEFLTSEANSMRWWAYKAGINIGKDHFLFGTGPGIIMYDLTQYQSKDPLKYWNYHLGTDNLHNEIIDSFATGGIFGLISYLMIWGSMFFYLFKGIVQKSDEKKLFIAIGFSLVLFFGFNQLFFRVIGTMFLPWMALAFILILTDRVTYKHHIFKPITKIICSTISVLICVFLLFWSLRFWLAEYYHGQAILRDNDHNYYRKSAKLFPLIDEYLSNYGYYNYINNFIVLEKGYNVNFSDQERKQILTDSAKSLKRAAEIRPNSPINWINYGGVLLSMKEIDSKNATIAQESFSKAIKLSPKDPLVRLKISNFYKHTGDYEKAKNYLNSALELRDRYTSVDIYLAYCKLYSLEHNQQRAFDMFKKAKKAGLSKDSSDYKLYSKRFKNFQAK